MIPPKKSLVELYKDNATDNNLLLETLWGRCVFETYKDKDTDDLHYFNYLYDVMFSCLGQGDNLTWDCMNNVVNWIGADALAVSECIYYSWKEPLNN